MITILVDHNIEGQALMLWRLITTEGWSELLPLQFIMFSQVNLPPESDDRTVWRFAQENRMILLTANRNMAEEDSLEQTIREENTPTSLPILTIGNVKRMIERDYRERCVEQLLEVNGFRELLGKGTHIPSLKI
jgi:predicted nuclease of predicted toxin-antitoxin system